IQPALLNPLRLSLWPSPRAANSYRLRDQFELADPADTDCALYFTGGRRMRRVRNGGESHQLFLWRIQSAACEKLDTLLRRRTRHRRQRLYADRKLRLHEHPREEQVRAE